MSAAQPAHSAAADLAAWVLDAGRAVGGSTRGGRVRHGPDGEVETVVHDQAVRLVQSWRDVTRNFRASLPS